MSTPPPSPYQPPQGPNPGQPQGQPAGQPHGQPSGQPQVPPPPPAYGGQPPQWGAPGSYGAPQGGDSPKNFFAALFDWRFHTLITPKLVSWVYLAVMILSVVYWLFMVFVSFATEPVMGVLVLLVGPIVLVISLAFFRMTLEFYFALVRMSDDIHRSLGLPKQR